MQARTSEMERQDAKDARKFQEPDEELDRLAVEYEGRAVGDGWLDLTS